MSTCALQDFVYINERVVTTTICSFCGELKLPLKMLKMLQYTICHDLGIAGRLQKIDRDTWIISRSKLRFRRTILNFIESTTETGVNSCCHQNDSPIAIYCRNSYNLCYGEADHWKQFKPSEYVGCREISISFRQPRHWDRIQFCRQSKFKPMRIRT